MRAGREGVSARRVLYRLRSITVATMAAALILVLVTACSGGAESEPCDPLPEGETLEECELAEAHWRFNHIIPGAYLRQREPRGGLYISNFNSHGIDYQFFLSWLLYRHETGAELDAFDEFFLLQDAVMQRHTSPSWRDFPAPYDPENDPEIASYVAWAVENFHGGTNSRDNYDLTLQRWDFKNALAEIYLNYRNSREAMPGEARVNHPEYPIGPCTMFWPAEALAPLSPEAIIALVRAYSDSEYVLDMRGLLYRGGAMSHLDAIYANSLIQVGIDPDSLPFVGYGLTRYFDSHCDSRLLSRLWGAHEQGESSVDICEVLLWRAESMSAEDRSRLVHPVCLAHGEDFGDGS